MLNSAAFKAMAHPVRRDILRRLRAGPLSAGELAESYSMSKPSLSAHFNSLRSAELIFATREGNRILYSLNVSVADEVVSAVMELFGVDPETQRAARGEHVQDS